MSVHSLIEKQREFYFSHQTKSIDFRISMLQKLKQAMIQHEQDLYLALKADLNKSEEESYLTEYQIVIQEINYALKHIRKWNKPKKVKTPISHFPSSSYIYQEPYGIVLILSPWNYPFQLAMAPLVGAIACGNCVILKPSKNSSHTTSIIRKIISETFPSEYVASIGEEYTYDEILSEQYDYIFFTGSERVGKIVMEAASRYVTPVSLELGGKSPCIIDKTCNLNVIAKRLAWGKLLNSGQTCVAPDYVYIDESIYDECIQKVYMYMEEMYNDSLENDQYPKIINEHHFNRLTKLIHDYPNKIGGQYNEKSHKIAPCIMKDVSWSDDIMQEEIFGPILPFLSYKSIEEVLPILVGKPKPLACYVMSEDQAFINRILNTVSFGGGCINDVVMHLANDSLPFGGVGSSGIGSYHGKASLETFSHQKSILKNKTWIDINLRYAPYSEKKLKLIKKVQGE